MRISPYLALATLLTSAAALAQAPGAHWQVVTGVSGAPSQRRENPGVASATKMYVFGGRSGSSGGAVMNDLWEFDGSTWTQKTANGAVGSPPKRDRAAICWDSFRDRLIVFGGDDGTGKSLGDTWEWNPSTNKWSNITPAAPAISPPARRWSSMAQDPSTGILVLFGGLSGGTHLNDTWGFGGGSTWIPLGTTGTPPAARRQHHLVARPDYRDIILCAGQDASLSAPANWRTDTWRWTGTDWVQIPTTTQPAAVVANDATYDPIRKRLVLAGGNPIKGGSPTGSISEFDSIRNDWIIRPSNSTFDPVLGRVSRFFMAYVPALGKVYKISGQVPYSGASPTTTVSYQSDPVANFKLATTGCNTSAGLASLTAPALPWLGRSLVMEVHNAPAGSSTLFVAGVLPTSIGLGPLKLGDASCVLTVDPLFTGTMPISSSTGRPTFTVPIPGYAWLVGGPPMMCQAVIYDPAAAPTKKFSVSNRSNAVFGKL